MTTLQQQAFETFWALYPRKVGRLAAETEYLRAQKLASDEEIIDGVERYKRTKPAYADWCHPRTWLHQGRWMDQPEASVVTEPWYVECERLHNCTCVHRSHHEIVMLRAS